MIFGDGVKLVLNNLYRRKGRTFLTALGVTIGTAAIVGMIALGLGLKAAAMSSFDDFGDVTTLQIWQGYSENPQDEPKELTKQSVNEFKQIPGVAGIEAGIDFWGEMEMKMGRMVGRSSIEGIEVAEAQDFPFKMEEGVFLKGKKEAVLTYNIPEMMHEKKRRSRSNRDEDECEMYGGPEEEEVSRMDMLNKNLEITLKKNSGADSIEKRVYKVKVVGILSEGEGDHGRTIYLPIEMVRDMKKWSGYEESSGRDRKKEKYDSIKIKIGSREEVEGVVEAVKNLGYETWSPAEELKNINKFFVMVQLILGGIGAISLLVASIGIMNTMFMSILERTREIGIMKVVGASIPDIRRLFLMESGIIGLLGGISGLLMGYGVVAVINAIARSSDAGMMVGGADKIAIVPIWLALFSLAFAIVIGVIAGFIPAQRAARINPLQAIRPE